MSESFLFWVRRQVRIFYKDKSSFCLFFVSEKYPVAKDLLVSKNRSEAVAKARHILIALLRQNTDLSLNQIGLFLGGRSHSTVLSSLKKVEGSKDLSTDLDNINLQEKVG